MCNFGDPFDERPIQSFILSSSGPTLSAKFLYASFSDASVIFAVLDMNVTFKVLPIFTLEQYKICEALLLIALGFSIVNPLVQCFF